MGLLCHCFHSNMIVGSVIISQMLQLLDNLATWVSYMVYFLEPEVL